MQGPVQRSESEQRLVEEETAKLALYHYATCGFSMRVRHAIAALSLNVELRDIHQDRDNLGALLAGGGRSTVPCLRIEDDESVQWMYESADIVRYLVERFTPEELT
jgi:glutathione S-transferase